MVQIEMLEEGLETNISMAFLLIARILIFSERGNYSIISGKLLKGVWGYAPHFEIYNL